MLQDYSTYLFLNNALVTLRNGFALLILGMMLLSCNGQNRQETEAQTEVQQSSPSSSDWPSEYADQISQVVRRVFEDSKGRLWFATQNGAFYIYNDELIELEGITGEYGELETIRDITEVKNGAIWLAHTGGLSCFLNDQVQNYHTKDGLVDFDIWNVESDSNGQVWFGTYNGAGVFDGTHFKGFDLPEGIKNPSLGVSSSKMVHCIREDSNGNLWFCTNAGLFMLQEEKLISVSNELGIDTPFINEVLEDQDGTIWVSSSIGVFKIEGGKAVNITTELGDPGKGAGSMEIDTNGTLWFVYDQHHLYTYDGDKIIEFQKSKENPGPVIYDIFKDRRDRLWFVGFGGAFRLEAGEFVNITKNGPF